MEEVRREGYLHGVLMLVAKCIPVHVCTAGWIVLPDQSSVKPPAFAVRLPIAPVAHVQIVNRHFHDDISGALYVETNPLRNYHGPTTKHIAKLPIFEKAISRGSVRERNGPLTWTIRVEQERQRRPKWAFALRASHRARPRETEVLQCRQISRHAWR